MGDPHWEGGKEPLTERERKALQELARQIVREAGLRTKEQQEPPETKQHQ